jgi:phospholipid/cholesterol/gamma-HCH transport system substrate-binding protein
MALKRELRVGIFVLSGLFVMGLVIFLIGDARNTFESKTSYKTSFTDVQGLVPGSVVRMGGLDIGRVQEVEFSGDPDRKDIVITLSVVKEIAPRVRVDSVTRIEAKGMLGDKMLSISPGAPSQPVLKEGEFILSSEGNDILGRLDNLSEKAVTVMGNLEKTSGTFAEPEFRQDVAGAVESARAFLDSLNSGDGYVPRLIRDGDEADRLSKAVKNLEETSRKLNAILVQVETATRRVNEGPGLAHEIIYGESGAQAIAQFGSAAEEVALTLKGIREGDGLAHQVLYGGEDANSQKIMEDLAAITGDFRVMSKNLREGKGTLGALMVDPSVYEDLKVLLGNVQRNEVLRALVRYSIKQDEAQPRVEVKDPEATPDGQAKK